MDPAATYDRLAEHLNAKEWDEATEAARNLWNWLARGGFAPARPPLDYPKVTAMEAPGLRHFIWGINSHLIK